MLNWFDHFVTVIQDGLASLKKLKTILDWLQTHYHVHFPVGLYKRFPYLHTPYCHPEEQSPRDTFRSNGPCASKNQACTLCRSLCWSRPHSYLSYTLWRNKRDRRQSGQQTKPPHLEQTEGWGRGLAGEKDYGLGKRHFDAFCSFSLQGSEIFQCSFLWHAC